MVGQLSDVSARDIDLTSQGGSARCRDDEEERLEERRLLLLMRM